MKKLTTADVFTAVRLLKSYGLRELAKDLAAKSDSPADLWANGYDFVWALFDQITTEGGEADLYRFLAGPFEMTQEAVKELPIGEMLENLKTLAEENNLPAFFKSAARLMK